MRQIREVMRLRYGRGLAIRQVAQSVGIGRTAVNEYFRRIREAGLVWPLPENMTDEDIEKMLFPPDAKAPANPRILPDWSHVHRELKRKGVTLQLLWEEYRQACPEGYAYSRYCQLYRIWEKKADVVMRQYHKAGEGMYVDYPGMTMPVVDRGTGEVWQAEVFVAVLGASDYTYAEATRSQGLKDWIGSHVRAFEFYDGATELLIPDNLKSGVTKAHRYEPWINTTYQRMATHYGCAVMPARPMKPRDKAKVEKGVQDVERRVMAPLRNRTFFSLHELNLAIRERLEAYNNKPFQKRPGSRKDLFETLEKPALGPLPAMRFEYEEWKKARVHIDYHLEVEHHYYSVPYQLVKEEVEVRHTANVVEVFYKGRRVASHAKSFVEWGYTTQAEHMPQNHREHAGWSPTRLVEWAGQAGSATKEVVERILGSRKHAQQGYRHCLGIMSLGRKYGNERLEAACRRVSNLPYPNGRSIESILKNGLDQEPLMVTPVSPALVHEHLRGAAYYQSNN